MRKFEEKTVNCKKKHTIHTRIDNKIFMTLAYICKFNLRITQLFFWFYCASFATEMVAHPACDKSGGLPLPPHFQ